MPETAQTERRCTCGTRAGKHKSTCALYAVIVGTITRGKLYAHHGVAGGSAWKYLYNVKIEGVETRLGGFDRLDEATRIAKKYGANKIVKAWEVSAS